MTDFDLHTQHIAIEGDELQEPFLFAISCSSSPSKEEIGERKSTLCAAQHDRVFHHIYRSSRSHDSSSIIVRNIFCCSKISTLFSMLCGVDDAAENPQNPLICSQMTNSGKFSILQLRGDTETLPLCLSQTSCALSIASSSSSTFSTLHHDIETLFDINLDINLHFNYGKSFWNNFPPLTLGSTHPFPLHPSLESVLQCRVELSRLCATHQHIFHVVQHLDREELESFLLVFL